MSVSKEAPLAKVNRASQEMIDTPKVCRQGTARAREQNRKALLTGEEE
jgi:hypothetical protein